MTRKASPTVMRSVSFGVSKWRGPTGHASVLPRHNEIAWPLARKVCRDLEIPPPTASR